MKAEFTCKLICYNGWWSVKLPFRAGEISLDDAIEESFMWSKQLRIVNHLCNGGSVDELLVEDSNILEKDIMKLLKKIDFD